MHSERKETAVLATVAFNTGVSRRRRRRASVVEIEEDEEEVVGDGDSVLPRREMTRKVKWVIQRSWTDKLDRVLRCNSFSLRNFPKTFRFFA